MARRVFKPGNLFLGPGQYFLMTLQIPTRKDPRDSSFPTSPTDVKRWMRGLETLDAGHRARQLHRGLKHSNRLQSNHRNRVDTLLMMEPMIDEALDELLMLFFEHPLPLARKPQNAFDLGDSLLQELAYGWKIVVNDTYSSLLGGQAGMRSQAILRTLRVFGKRMLHNSLAYRSTPEGLLSDANKLYGLAEESGIAGEALLLDHDASEPWSIKQAYLHLQLLSLANLRSLRRRQIPLVCQFLQGLTDNLDLHAAQAHYRLHEIWFAIHLQQDTPPLPWRQYAPAQRRSLRVFNLNDVLPILTQSEKQAPHSLPRELENQRLSQHSINRLCEQFLGGRARREQRAICEQTIHAQSGLKDIHALLAQGSQSSQSAAELPHNKPTADLNSQESWTISNRSRHGVRLSWNEARASDIQVGELIALLPHPDSKPGQLMQADHAWEGSLSSIHLARIVWVDFFNEGKLDCGAAFISDEVAAVLVENKGPDGQGLRQECLLCIQIPDEDESGLADIRQSGIDGDIRKTADHATQSLPINTLIAPAGSFHPKELLTIYHQGKAREWAIKSSLPTPGSFDFYELTPLQ